ncbi:hypothetical protein [Vibrio spartinae]|uniref:Uncharacterized protein n=1 Tax=Vibrio spartinae TaxID=1918945 RepID=A0A1N6M5Q9_9VIBR|nr:hypothetical protein [Vibrio spartinae]SIO94779.1 hypothetical protein VSP9026_02509 [Vibrio spartinae]
MNEQMAYHYSFESGLFVGVSTVFIEHGYENPIKPQCSTFTPLPEFNSATQRCRYISDRDNWNVEIITDPVTAYNKKTQQKKLFDDESLITDEYTLLEPDTEFDVWEDKTELWVTDTNAQKQFNANAEYQWVVSELDYVDVQLKYHATGDTKRQQLTVDDWNAYAIALRDYTTVENGLVVVLESERPTRPNKQDA